MALDPNQVAQKWSRNLSGATQSITDGVNGVTEAPGVAAARQKTLWLQRVQASQDKWATRVAAVPLSEWQEKMRTVGIPRIASGATANQPKFAQFMTAFLPHVENVARTVRAMPKGTIDDSIARAAAQIRGNAQFKRQ